MLNVTTSFTFEVQYAGSWFACEGRWDTQQEAYEALHKWLAPQNFLNTCVRVVMVQEISIEEAS